MSDELDNLLKESTGILMAIDELHNELPKITEAKNKIDKTIGSFNTSLNDKRNEISDLIKKGKNDVQKTIMEFLKKFENIEIYADDLEEVKSKIDKLKEEQNKIVSAIKILQNNKGNDKNSNNAVSTDLLSDYSSPKTIQYLYEKYKDTNIPVIVRKAFPSESSLKPWTPNYCFYVEKIENGYAVGSYYEYGKIKNKSGTKPPAINIPSYILHENKEEVTTIVKTIKG